MFFQYGFLGLRRVLRFRKIAGTKLGVGFGHDVGAV
jgi:hypothetical protein